MRDDCEQAHQGPEAYERRNFEDPGGQLLQGRIEGQPQDRFAHVEAAQASHEQAQRKARQPQIRDEAARECGGRPASQYEQGSQEYQRNCGDKHRQDDALRNGGVCEDTFQRRTQHCGFPIPMGKRLRVRVEGCNRPLVIRAGGGA
ncbi:MULTISPECIES: hypothetical protein [unclassified Phenylobacterium]|uniref:hypothetical protein n=1 Tax=unclassified Phenylobacterium TaxID=2640670 RepID=UPI000A6248E9|nr:MULTISPECIES: hypothetical protein [unclassified Phenylobacterium]